MISLMFIMQECHSRKQLVFSMNWKWSYIFKAGFLPFVGLLVLLEDLKSEELREPDPEIPLEAAAVDLLLFEQQ